ncbi:hypothetical protein Tco_0878246 [Tanacetum coccineum]|uniref:Reverse transcriptase RNase H-like domain-containing protein n=1 Tax=Tanacetum coccineum TaxID=301880 RepID=A0ABQ5BXD6_9ASTR
MRFTISIHVTEIHKMWLPLRKRLCRTTPGPGYEVGESSAAGTARRVGPTTARADLMDLLIVRAAQVAGCLELDDARYDRALLRARVNMLESDSPFHRRTAVLMEEEARLSRAAWAQSMDACDQTHSEVIPSVYWSWFSSPEIVETPTTPSVTSANSGHDRRGVNAVLEARIATRWRRSAIPSGIGARRNERMWRECTYQELHEMSTRILQGYKRSGQLDPVPMQEAIEMATGLMERRINTLAENKRKLEDTPRNNQTYQQNKRQNTGRDMLAWEWPFRSNCPSEDQESGKCSGVPGLMPVGVAGQNPRHNVVTVPERTCSYGHYYRLAPSEMKELGINDRLSDKVFIRLVPHHGVLQFIRQEEDGSLRIKQEPKSSDDNFGVVEERGSFIKAVVGSAPILALPEGSEDFMFTAMLQEGLGDGVDARVKTYLYGTKCTVFTDQKSLQHILNQKELIMRQRPLVSITGVITFANISLSPGKANVLLRL